MLGEKHEKAIDLRVKSAVEAFLMADDSITIEDISKLLKISQSTIRRDLNNLDRIANIYGSTKAEKILSLIREKLLRIKQIHNSKKL